MNLCEACGKPVKAGVYIGGALVCSSCAVEVSDEIDRRRDEGLPVNALQIAKKIFRETYSAGNYPLRDIPQDLWTRAKHRAVDDGDSLRDLILKALHAYLRGENDEQPNASK